MRGQPVELAQRGRPARSDDRHAAVPGTCLLYTSRTDDEYELFYYNDGEWASAGRVRPHSDSLLYKVPEGALLYLKDHTLSLIHI